MVTRHELKELASYMLQDDFFVSLYLNVAPKDNPKDEWLLHFKNMARDALNQLKAEELRHAKPDIEHIEKFLSDRPEGMKRGLAVISCRSLNFWRVYHTAQPFINQLIIERDPYIKPLVSMLDTSQRYLVVVVAGTRARLLITGAGQIEGITTIARPPLTLDPTRDGSSGDMGQVRAQRKKEHGQRRLFKEVAAAVERTIYDERITRILLSGPDKVRGRFKDALPEPFKEKVVGEVSVDQNAGDSEILRRCQPVMHEIQRRFEHKALAELFDRAGAREGSVLGLSDVLTALQQGNVRKLYVMSNMVTPGMVCSNCGALTPERGRPCPYCDGKMIRVPYMLDLAIQKAIDQGASVDMLEESHDLARTGGIGAMLRY